MALTLGWVLSAELDNGSFANIDSVFIRDCAFDIPVPCSCQITLCSKEELDNLNGRTFFPELKLEVHKIQRDGYSQNRNQIEFFKDAFGFGTFKSTTACRFCKLVCH